MIEINAQMLAQLCNGELLNDNGRTFKTLSIDSRRIDSACLFVALKGENHDAHDFVVSAIEKGAAGVLISEIRPEYDLDSSCFIKCADTLASLQFLAKNLRAVTKSRFIGVTGSNGKTTVRSMIAHLLSEKYSCYSTEGNLNNHIGLPLTIANSPGDEDFTVLEMGMNNEGEIRFLADIAKPDIAVITNVGTAHIGNFESAEGIAEAKAEILEGLRPGGFAILPGDTPMKRFFHLPEGVKAIYFGTSPDNNALIENIQTESYSSTFDLTIDKQKMKFQINIPGTHNVYNAAAALALCHNVGLSFDYLAERIKSFVPVGARLEILERDGVRILLDCYNANPDSMREALTYLASCKSPKIAVLGEMRELGSMSVHLHKKIGAYAAECELDWLICLGKDAEYIASQAIECGFSPERAISLNSFDKAADLLRELLKEGTVVLFKASRGMRFEKIVQKLWPDVGKDLH